MSNRVTLEGAECFLYGQLVAGPLMDETIRTYSTEVKLPAHITLCRNVVGRNVQAC